MSSSDDPAVREALRRRAAREREDEALFETYIERQVRRRERRFWIWMGLMPGILFVAMMLLVAFLGDKRMRPLQELFTVAFYWLFVWVGYCAIRLVKTKREVSLPEGIGLGIGIFLLLVLANLAEFYVLFWASCAALAGISSL